MITSLILIAVITSGGLGLTYLFAERETFLWRLAAGHVVGSAVFGLVLFLLALVFASLPVPVVLGALVVTAAPVLLLRDPRRKKLFRDEWQTAKDRTQGATYKKLRGLAYYLFFFLLFVAFFDRAMIVASDGIFTGASQNLGDLPFHLGAIYSFTDGQNFPPQNPSFAGAKFTYPFVADLLTAAAAALGASVQSALSVQNVAWAFSLLVVFERFAARVTGDRFAGKLAPLLLFFSGGVGFLWFFKDLWFGAQGFWELLWNLPRDYTIGDQFRWGNSLVVLFITQRSLLLGMPLTVIVLGFLWKPVAAREETGNKAGGKDLKSLLPFLFVGLCAGALPLIHAHSLAVLFVVSAFWFAFSPARWREWTAFGAGVSLVALPALAWILSGSATDTGRFVGWHFGWDAKEENVLLFWLKNTGLFIPLLLAAVALMFYPRSGGAGGEEDEGGSAAARRKRAKAEAKRAKAGASAGSDPLKFWHFLFLAPFLFLFLVSNAFKFAPWEWDNIKLLIYWFAGSIPPVVLLLAWFWRRSVILRAVAAASLFVLTLAGALDVWRTASAQMRHGVFDRDAVTVAERIRERTEPDALFLNAPTYNSAVVLTGRRSLLRYLGHLSSHGIDYAEREADLKRIYAGDPSADILLKKHGIDYVIVSPRERESLTVRDEYFQKFQVVAEQGQYRVYKVSGD